MLMELGVYVVVESIEVGCRETDEGHSSEKYLEHGGADALTLFIAPLPSLTATANDV